MTKKLDYEPTTEDKLANEIVKNKNLNESLATKSLEVNHFRDDGEKQARDNKDLGEQLQDSRRQRDDFKIEAENWQKKAESLEKGLNGALTENNAFKVAIQGLEGVIKSNQLLKLSGIRRGLLFKELFYRFFRKGGK